MAGAPLFLVPPGELPAAGRYVLDGEEGRHAGRVRRVGAGERIDLADGLGEVAECVVVAVRAAALELQVRRRYPVPPPVPRFTVVQALPKGDRAGAAVEAMTEAGVDTVIPWAAHRCVVRWDRQRAERGRARWQAHARQAAKQAHRPWVPQVLPVASTAEVAALLGRASSALVLHGGAAEALARLTPAGDGEIVVTVGPEGGITDEELGVFADAGARACRLGPEVLRTSTAGVAALAVLAARTSRWA